MIVFENQIEDRYNDADAWKVAFRAAARKERSRDRAIQRADKKLADLKAGV
jgi:hypothetical protein